MLGDTALTPGEDGAPLPALAQVAAQQGKHLGKGLAANLTDGTPLAPFKFQNRGNTAIVGRNAAVFDFGRVQLKGRLAWLLWALVHIYLLGRFREPPARQPGMVLALHHLRERRPADHAAARRPGSRQPTLT